MTRASGVIVVIGIGNTYRRDDGVGIAVATALDARAMPNVVVKTGITDPMSLIEAWTGAKRVVIIDAAIANPCTPGRIRRRELTDVAIQSDGLHSHSVDVGRAHALGKALGRVPGEVKIFTIEVLDTDHGIGLSPQVAGAVPKVVDMVVAEIDRALPV
ncbi:hydrogenase maturation protease [Mycobacterium sp. E2479]|uniref:hydrogenase maturation protease n=1 Tax=Mycobacterium sp. E2479 TaxID=1834134 RepID=UPI0008012D2A|nr:hydrogenase maturation protease [Mycobacterium sp. E2479]OBH60315.1 peptidase M52 [Mycobacterium sp. E2479]